MIDWNDNAKAAVSAYNDWALENDLAIHAFFEHLTSIGPAKTKTVADAVEQEGEKWTHETAESEYCRILIDKPDQFGNVVILKEEWGYSDYPLSSLKPIKPTISESQAQAITDFAEEVNEAHISMMAEEYLARREII